MIKGLFYIDKLTAGGAEKILCKLFNNMDPSSFDITVHVSWKSEAVSLLQPYENYKYVYGEFGVITENSRKGMNSSLGDCLIKAELLYSLLFQKILHCVQRLSCVTADKHLENFLIHIKERFEQ